MTVLGKKNTITTLFLELYIALHEDSHTSLFLLWVGRSNFLGGSSEMWRFFEDGQQFYGEIIKELWIRQCEEAWNCEKEQKYIFTCPLTCRDGYFQKRIWGLIDGDK